MIERIETVIVGAGQAGLATSYFLKQHGREHVVLEQSAHVANAWRDQRWDSFTLVSPNWSLRIPGAEYDGPDPDGYMSRADVISYFERYVEQFEMPVQVNSRVDSVEPIDGGGFFVRTGERTFRADTVVIATGFEQHPKLPAAAADISPAVTQLHSSQYRNPNLLPEGAVLVVGSAQSGGQIAEEIYRSGRKVYLSISGNAGRVPRRYRGRDIFEWLWISGFFDRTADQFPFPRERFAPPHVSGADGGHTLNLHQFAADGVTLLGHLSGANGALIHIAPDLHGNLERVDGFEQQACAMIDGFIQARGLDAPQEELPTARDGYAQPIVEQLDLQAAGIASIIWATGYAFEYEFVKASVLDDSGFPIQDHGVTEQQSLYFVGMPWMPALRSGILAGVGQAAEHTANLIAQRIESRGRTAVSKPTRQPYATAPAS